MTRSSEIVLLGINLAEGESTREVCPTCGGGSSREKSLSITRGMDGILVWQCFRASCQTKGANGNAANIPIKLPTKNTKPKWEFSGKTEPLSPQLIDRIQELWGITNPEHWYWTPEYGGRIAMSIRSPKYLHRGWVLRDITGTANNKALTFVAQDEEGLSWYKTNPHAPTVLVEDIPSSVRASTYMNAVALLGSGVGIARAQEIATYATRPIIVALDQDATKESFRIAYKYSLSWGDVILCPLHKDIKNMTELEVQQLLGEYL